MGHDPTEHVQEHITHEAAHGGHDEHGGGHGGEHGHGHHSNWWITAAALTAAILAAFAAVSGSLATRHLTESTLIRITANDDWNFYQAKSIKNSILDMKVYSSQLAKMAPRKKDIDKMAEYAEQLPEIQDKANGEQELSKKHLETHETYEFAETMFHISIAVVAIAVVAKRKMFWYVSMVFGLVGAIAFGAAYVKAPPAEKSEEPAATAPATQSEHKPAQGETGGSATKAAIEHGSERAVEAATKAASQPAR